MNKEVNIVKKRLISAAAAAIMALAASGCGETSTYGVDYPEKYAKFLDYTFKDEYTVELVAKEQYSVNDSGSGKEKTVGYRRWKIEYADKNGVKHDMELLSTPAEKTDDKAFDKARSDIDMYFSVTGEITDIISAELYNNTVKNYFDAGEWQEDTDYTFTGSTFVVQALSCELAPLTVGKGCDKDVYDMVKKSVSKKDGISLADCSLAEEISKTDVFTFVRVYLFDRYNENEMLNKMQQLSDDLLANTGKPQNVHFSVLYCDKSTGEPVFTNLYERNIVLGKETTVEHESSEVLEFEDYEQNVLDALGMKKAAQDNAAQSE